MFHPEWIIKKVLEKYLFLVRNWPRMWQTASENSIKYAKAEGVSSSRELVLRSSNRQLNIRGALFLKTLYESVK